ncbi:MAG: ATPase, T2SS/T4P/T4SS family [Methanoregulaceae archaeon]
MSEEKRSPIGKFLRSVRKNPFSDIESKEAGFSPEDPGLPGTAASAPVPSVPEPGSSPGDARVRETPPLSERQETVPEPPDEPEPRYSSPDLPEEDETWASRIISSPEPRHAEIAEDSGDSPEFRRTPSSVEESHDLGVLSGTAVFGKKCPPDRGAEPTGTGSSTVFPGIPPESQGTPDAEPAVPGHSPGQPESSPGVVSDTDDRMWDEAADPGDPEWGLWEDVPEESRDQEPGFSSQDSSLEKDLSGITEQDEKIITVDQTSPFSGLILPKGATFALEELKRHDKIPVLGVPGSGKPAYDPDIALRRALSEGAIEDFSGSGTVPGEEKPAKPGFFSRLKEIGIARKAVQEYNPQVHGPLVNLSLPPRPGIEEIEMYPVNEPYAYIRIIYDHSTHEYTYQVIEPILTPAEQDLFSELKQGVFERLDINTKDITRADAEKALTSAVDDIVSDYGLSLTPVQREKILYNMLKDFLGDGLVDPVMHDKYIEDISCDGVNSPIFVYHASYESMKTTLSYHEAIELDSFVTRLAQRAGKYISIADPILDATMGDGSRIQMTLGTEVTAHGSTFTIRKFRDEPITPTDLIEWSTFSPLSIAYLWLAVETGKSAIFAGGTASGKTTSLNAISLFIPPMAKIVSLEDTRELKLPHPNWIPSVTRDSFDSGGRGEIDMYELLRAALRQRPEYIIVGEVRGREAQSLFQAMSTGHVTYSTMHADSVPSVVHRIENPPLDVPRNMLSALDIVCVQVQARVGGQRIRRNKQIIEILDIDPRTNELITNEVFKWRPSTDEISYSGKSFVLEEIMEEKGWNEDRMKEELRRRQEVLEWMRVKKIRHYKDVSNILIQYFRNPEAVMERVRAEIHE